MYEWHLSEEEWDRVSLSFDTSEQQRAIIAGTLDVPATLVMMLQSDPSRVAQMQKAVAQLAFRLQYSQIELGSNGLRVLAQQRGGDGTFLPDAYDISMTRVLDIHAGLTTHLRRSRYVECEVWKGMDDGAKVLLQTSDWCTVLDSAHDPYSQSQPALESPLFLARRAPLLV